MCPIDLGMEFDAFAELSQPLPIPPATYEFIVDSKAEETTTGVGRPMWVFYLKIINNPEFVNRSIRYACLMPWDDPQTGQKDLSNTFNIVNLIKGTGMEIHGGVIPDKEFFFGRRGAMSVTQEARKNDPEIIDNRAKVLTKRKGGGVS